MSKRIENFKIFIGLIVIISLIGGLIVVTNTLDKTIKLTNYSDNLDNFDYDVNVDYDGLNIEMFLAGEEIYLDDAEYNLNIKNTPLVFLNKINRLSYENSNANIKEATSFYENKKSSNSNMFHDESLYKKIKTIHINDFFKSLDDDSVRGKYLSLSKTFKLGEKDGFDYIKEIVSFVNVDTYLVEHMLVIDSKYNHNKDKLEYSKSYLMDNEYVDKVNELIYNTMNVYNELNSKKTIIRDDLKGIYNLNARNIYIFDRTNVIVTTDNDKNIKYSFTAKTIEN